MKRLLMTAAASLVLAGSFSLPAFADAPRGGQHLSGAPHGSHNAQGNQNNRRDHNAQSNNRASQNDHRNVRGPQADRGRQVSPPRAYTYARPAYSHYSHRWQRGQRLGAYNNHYRVIDYRDYRLERPPYGYRWVEDDNGDYILAALAGGLIAAIIANNY